MTRLAHVEARDLEFLRFADGLNFTARRDRRTTRPPPAACTPNRPGGRTPQAAPAAGANLKVSRSSEGSTGRYLAKVKSFARGFQIDLPAAAAISQEGSSRAREEGLCFFMVHFIAWQPLR